VSYPKNNIYFRPEAWALGPVGPVDLRIIINSGCGMPAKPAFLVVCPRIPFPGLAGGRVSRTDHENLRVGANGANPSPE